MRIRRRKAVVVQTHQVTTVHWNRQPIVRWCPDCAAQVEMLTPESAAEIAGISSRDLFRRVEANEVHFIDLVERGLLICCDSIRRTPASNVIPTVKQIK
jgi:hypothetical protein